MLRCSYQLPVTSYQLPVTSYQLPVAVDHRHRWRPCWLVHTIADQRLQFWQKSISTYCTWPGQSVLW